MRVTVQATKQEVCLAFGEKRQAAHFAGLWARQWASALKIGVETIDLYAFPTTEPNAEV